MNSTITWLGILLCLSQSAMLSGLNLACFAVSRLQLDIGAGQGNQDAIKVLALRKDANFLLSTILWGNVAVNALLALLSGSVLGGVAGFLFSTIFITIFAEIGPQAYFSRNALRMAAFLSPVIRFYQILLYPVAKPTAKVLDLWLGLEGVHYLREQTLRDYILKSMGAAGSDINRFEGRGAVNFLALDSRLVGLEGHVLDPRSIIPLPVADGRLAIPSFGSPAWKDFLERVQSSGKKWIVLTDPDGKPQLLLNANRFSRLLLLEANEAIDPRECCVEPLITTNPGDTLEGVLLNAKFVDTQLPDQGVILLWADEKRVIAHYDVMKRLFDGVFTLVPGAS
ncbi:MAG: CNNM domain-containing protein [Chromatiaceae bacterium]